MIKGSKNFKKKNHNLIILTKGGLNEDYNKRKTNTKNSTTILTLKVDDFVIKKNILNTVGINREKILKTVTSLRQELIDNENDESEYNNRKKMPILENKLKTEKYNNILIGSVDDENINNNLNIVLNLNNSIKINKKKLNKKISEITFKGSNNAMINKTNSELDKYTEMENKKKSSKDMSKFAVKYSKNEVEIFDKNNISIYEYIKFNNDNYKVKDSSITYNDSVYNSKVKKNSINTNIYEINNLQFNKSINNNINNNIENKIKFRNNYIKSQNPINEQFKTSEISNSLKNNIKNVYNESLNDNISENKKLITIKESKMPKSSSFEKNKNNVEIKKIETRESNSKLNNINIDKNKFRVLNENRKISCFLCEKFFKIDKIFVPRCKIHYMCRKCLKSYYEDILENNNFSLKCPDLNCGKEIDLDLLKQIISKSHFEMLQNKAKKEKIENIDNNDSNIQKEIYLKDTKLLFNSKVSEENIKLYTQKHVLDINSNEKFYMFNKNKDIYCNRCLKPALFTKINGLFIKCLNCHNRICKYCLKEFEDMHMDIMHKNHCKVYYRKDNDDYIFENSSKIIKYLTQLFFVFAMYYLMFAGVFYLSFRFLKNLFKFNYYRNSCLKFVVCFLSKLISFICVIISSPFLISIYPFFPAIIILTDY